ncbi:DUF4857 domain-containing protein [Carboxylicivirga sp. N1Y90]|uniref:DUF4857 domain-containing protein n=1 Tax=Carboxylicivirga fragile TaxID=3417571 RepID=UPI003D3263C8|nr:DUF4857 domain-containing protein [Marinilabiliaceae bacterium N1Y90]
MKLIRYSIIILATLILAWQIPSLYHIVSDTSGKNVFTYYSSIEEAFCSIDFDEKENKLVRSNLNNGKVYSETDFDSILPLFYYRQLLSDGRFPDSINGKAISTKEINASNFFYRYNAKDKNTPSIPIYTLFESFSGRVKLEMPGDVFRITNSIEFINPITNEVDQEKSARFMRVFEQSSFVFPARAAYGNPSTRKPYDEGYFIIDNKGQIFHLKMVNGKPFLRNTNFPEGINPVFIATQEPNDKSFYAFVFDDKNKVYIITTDGYKVVQIKTPLFDLNKDRMMVMANPLYWNVNILSVRGKESYALKASTKEIVDSLSILRPVEEDFILSYVLPFELRFKSGSSDYIKPFIKFAKIWVLLINVLLAISYGWFASNKNGKWPLFNTVWIILTGLFGLIPSIIFKN